jgi:histidine triad (HIT) family protein
VSETIFTRIIRGEIPCHRVYEDDEVFAFLDIAPLAPGHVLVVPKEPAPTLDLLSDGAAAAVGRVLPRIARAVMAATGTRDYNVLQNNGAAAHQAVPHVHFHVVPRPDDVRGLGIRWPAGRLEAEEGRRLAAAVSAALAAG